MSREKILVVEDETDILELIDYKLSQEGFQVLQASDGETGLEQARLSDPDLVLLDIMLPGLDGLEVCRRLKRDPVTETIPIIIVSAKGEESDVVTGLELGADDYLVKPFSPRELAARSRAVLRRRSRKQDSQASERYSFPGLIVDPVKHEVLVEGSSIDFTATEFRLLEFLARYPGRAFTRQQLLNRVIGEDAIVIDRNIDVHVRALRKKLGDHRDRIETLRGVGYRFRGGEL